MLLLIYLLVDGSNCGGLALDKLLLSNHKQLVCSLQFSHLLMIRICTSMFDLIQSNVNGLVHGVLLDELNHAFGRV